MDDDPKSGSGDICCPHPADARTHWLISFCDGGFCLLRMLCSFFTWFTILHYLLALIYTYVKELLHFSRTCTSYASSWPKNRVFWRIFHAISSYGSAPPLGLGTGFSGGYFIWIVYTDTRYAYFSHDYWAISSHESDTLILLLAFTYASLSHDS